MTEPQPAVARAATAPNCVLSRHRWNPPDHFTWYRYGAGSILGVRKPALPMGIGEAAGEPAASPAPGLPTAHVAPQGETHHCHLSSQATRWRTALPVVLGATEASPHTHNKQPCNTRKVMLLCCPLQAPEQPTLCRNQQSKIKRCS